MSHEPCLPAAKNIHLGVGPWPWPDNAKPTPTPSTSIGGEDLPRLVVPAGEGGGRDRDEEHPHGERLEAGAAADLERTGEEESERAR